MKGDYFRYLSEVASGEAKKGKWGNLCVYLALANTAHQTLGKWIVCSVMSSVTWLLVPRQQYTMLVLKNVQFYQYIPKLCK